MNFDFQSLLAGASVWAIPILLAITLHEAAHGWVASKLGDPTAKNLGRVTFNPFKHIDLFGTILLPSILLLVSGGQYMFGFAKPVPVVFQNLKRPRRDMILVAAAGPVTNFLLAILAGLLLHAAPHVPDAFVPLAAANLRNLLFANVIFGVFNLIPLPPLDGGRIAVGILPRPFSVWLAKLEHFGFMIIIFFFFALPWILKKLDIDFNIFWWLIWAPAMFVIDLIATITGLK
ncbi:MAG: site-2 protease family protein [Magnetovibrio sp.]|nr:site-2 protease family protein [Magnetovibrio sp.]